MSGVRQEETEGGHRVEPSRREGQRDRELDHIGESETEHRVSYRDRAGPSRRERVTESE
jgi:hypothetical protein